MSAMPCWCFVRLKTDLRSGQLYRLQVVATGRVPRVDFTSVSFLHRPIGFGALSSATRLRAAPVAVYHS